MNRIGRLRRTVLIGLSCAIMVGFVPLEVRPLAAQDHERQPIFEGQVEELMWSPDSRFLAFTNRYSPQIQIESDYKWYNYDTETQMIGESQVWPFYPTLSDAERENFNPLDDSYIFLSPNGRYIVYAVQDDVLDYSQSMVRFGVAIGDLETGEYTKLLLYISNPVSGPKYWNIKWSADSTAFVIFDQQLTPVVHHISNFEDSLTDVQVTALSELDFAAWDVYDVSENGQQVLLNVFTAELEYKIMVWRVPEIAPLYIISDFDTRLLVRGNATFAPNNPNRILLHNEQGLIAYDLESQQTIILDDRFPFVDGDLTAFSPDGRWLAYYRWDDLFVIPMSDYLEE